MVSLGHRSGAVIVVRTDSPAKTIKDLRGRRVAIPNHFAVDHLFVRGMLKEHGMTVRDVEQVEMARCRRPCTPARSTLTPLASPSGAVEVERSGPRHAILMIPGSTSLKRSRTCGSWPATMSFCGPASSWIVSKPSSISGRLVMICTGWRFSTL